MFIKQSFYILFICFEISGSDVCYFKDDQLLNVSCKTSYSEINSLVWKIMKSNTSLTLFNCTPSGCRTLTSDLPFSASVTPDSKNNTIISSNLIGSLTNVSYYDLKQYSNLICETPSGSYNICEAFVLTADPENVSCTPISVDDDIMIVGCQVYPGGRLTHIRVYNDTFSKSLDLNWARARCFSVDPDSDHRYLTLRCGIDIFSFDLAPGNNNVEITFSTMETDSDFTISSNILIPVYDDLQNPTCGQPVFKEDGSSFTYECTVPLFLGEVDCILKSRTNGNRIETLDNWVSRIIMDKNKTFATQCPFHELAADLGAGHHELQVVMSSVNSEGKRITTSSDWKSIINFYLATEMNFTVNGSSEGAEVKFGDLILVNCNVDGYPASKLTLSQDNVWRLEFDSSPFSVGTIHSFQITSCSQSDVYTCSSLGSLTYGGETITKKVYVDIPCQLKLRSKRFAVSNTFYLGFFKDTAVVQIEVFGYPGPKSMKLFNVEISLNNDGVHVVYTNAEQSPNNGGVHVVYTQELGPYGTIYVAFNNTELIRNLGHFQLNVDNGYGNTSFTFYIQAGSGMSKYESTTSICLCFVYILLRFIL